MSSRLLSSTSCWTSLLLSQLSVASILPCNLQLRTRQLIMPPVQVPWRAARALSTRNASSTIRPISTSTPRFAEHKDRLHSNVEEHRKAQTSKPDNPHMTNTTSTFHADMPSVGEDKPPPDMISSVDPDYVPKDSKPKNTEKMTGGTQPGDPDKVSSTPDLAVGEMEGAEHKIEPLRRTGEDSVTMRSRLLCPYLYFPLRDALC